MNYTGKQYIPEGIICLVEFFYTEVTDKIPIKCDMNDKVWFNAGCCVRYVWKTKLVVKDKLVVVHVFFVFFFLQNYVYFYEIYKSTGISVSFCLGR